MPFGRRFIPADTLTLITWLAYWSDRIKQQRPSQVQWSPPQRTFGIKLRLLDRDLKRSFSPVSVLFIPCISSIGGLLLGSCEMLVFIIAQCRTKGVIIAHRRLIRSSSFAPLAHTNAHTSCSIWLTLSLSCSRCDPCCNNTATKADPPPIFGQQG